MRMRTLLAMVAAMSLLTVGCAATSSDTATPVESSSAPRDASVTHAPGIVTGPSAPAKMICSSEIRGAVKLTFGLSQAPRPTSTWSSPIFTCNYALRGGTLALSVNDALDEKTGRAYFTGLRSRLAGAQAISGSDSFGLPAFATPNGSVAFLKDGKTLRVDASALPSATLPDGFSQTQAAYAIASAVVACWTE
jgi:hypothetical protein